MKYSKSIKNYLKKNKQSIDFKLNNGDFNGFKSLLIDLLQKGIETGEIADKDEAYMLLDVIPNAKPNHLYSIYITLITCIKVGKNKYGKNRKTN